MKPPFLQIPIELFETVLADLSPNGFKLFMFVWRKTHGFQKQRDHISYEQISKATGISSKVTLKKVIDEIANIIAVTPGIGRSNMYEFDISNLHKSLESQPKGTENEPINTDNKVQEMNQMEIKGTESEPQKVQKVNHSSVKGTVSDVKGTENEPTIDNNTINTTTTTTAAGLKIINTEPEAQAALKALITNYQDYISVSFSPVLADEFKAYSLQVKPVWVANAYKATEDANVKNWNYPRAILDSCIQAGRWVDKSELVDKSKRQNGAHKNAQYSKHSPKSSGKRKAGERTDITPEQFQEQLKNL